MADEYIALTAIASIVVCIIAATSAVISIIWGNTFALQVSLTVFVMGVVIVFAMMILTRSGIFD
jgi:hypothetical protein